MARESKRKRDERRFGKPERLADCFFERKFNWAEIDGSRIGAEERAWNESMRALCRTAAATKVIDVTNVHDYCIRLQKEKILKFDQMIVNALPSFDLSFFEFRVAAELGPQVKAIGWALQAFDKGNEPQIVVDALFQFPNPTLYARCAKFVAGTMVMRIKASPDRPEEGLMCPVVCAVVALDEQGATIQPPFMQITQPWIDTGQDDWALEWARQSIFVCLLAQCFLNCKNVRLIANEPDREVNRERRKAGLKPFLRHHTINIEPMKQVLRAEGQVETVGLQKALHIVRGHFSNYGEDKPLFGRPGLHGTFWVPSHVRGTAREGIIMSDYNVKPPAGEA